MRNRTVISQNLSVVLARRYPNPRNSDPYQPSTARKRTKAHWGVAPNSSFLTNSHFDPGRMPPAPGPHRDCLIFLYICPFGGSSKNRTHAGSPNNGGSSASVSPRRNHLVAVGTNPRVISSAGRRSPTPNLRVIHVTGANPVAARAGDRAVGALIGPPAVAEQGSAPTVRVTPHNYPVRRVAAVTSGGSLIHVPTAARSNGACLGR